MSHKVDPIALAMKMMEVDSTSGREGEVIALVEKLLRDMGWNTTRIPVSPGRDNIYAVVGDSAAVTLSTHLDTVPPFIPPSLVDGRLHGRGACDAKGIAASMICAAETLRGAGIAVGLLFVVGEEVSHDGAHAANDFPNASKVLINGEPTENKLALGTKGAVRLTLRTEGIPAHSAYPKLGRSAIAAMAKLLVELEGVELPRHAVLGDTTVNIGVISGGVADNVVAPWAEARLMVRLVGEKDEVVQRMERWVAGRGKIEVGVAVPAIELGVIEGFETEVVAFATDIPALGTWGKPYLYGPGSILLAHRGDESVGVGEIYAGVEGYIRLVRGVDLDL